MKDNKAQIVLIVLGTAATALFSVFFFRELFPEYKVYQKKYRELEAFRSKVTGETIAPFELGVKQLVMERADKGPAKIDRCISCHVALKISDYSKTKVLYDKEGKPVLSDKGTPVLVENENYIWKKLDEEIKKLEKEGRGSEADALTELKRARVGDYVYDVTKVLSQHPLIGAETRPFENHSMEDYGCVVCHSGNGLGLMTDRAHGPVFDETYEIEGEGFKPQFLEKSPEHDPLFSKVFNDKPSHRLLFQVNPLYVGALIQAKCIACHDPDKREEEKPKFNPNNLTLNYQRGEELFIAQACYACHRIAGVSRGGVGPELTQEGNSYPWFVKESIVWPQADLKTSQMPNYRLDHEELEDLTTYLLGQKGESPARSGMEYRNRVKRWESGEKRDFEKPVVAAEALDVDYGLTLFATEGCAACHRLEGFTSSVGFASKETQKESRWFRSLFSETILGSELAKRVKEQGEEIDKRLVIDSQHEGLLEKIEKSHPGLIASFYAPFKFAARESSDPAFQERLHKVLMQYVQEYGLGRLIGPRPNWSGVYRSDRWLMEHFKNPQSLVPRSLMPVFPFDDTKFYALTHMLDVVGRANANLLKQQWSLTGFKPEEAYLIHCAQCHGDHREGNGPVAEWIYPIPKNLRSAEFLRNLTPERVKNSITHGIAGTPMAPWGEVGEGKEGEPVLNEQEISLITEWLYNFLPGQEVFREESDTPKWNYGPEEVLKDLKQERGGKVEPSPLFESVPNPKKGPDKTLYYLKKEFYTPENIEAGRHFFLENCATCHGNDADGSGLRAEAMYEAKPRMLTNLSWIDSKDDLSLLRSIKYGVAGTSMAPWGDLTNAGQRIDLVVYIRSLSEATELRSRVNEALYGAFTNGDRVIEQAREQASKKVEALKEKLEQATKASENEPTVEHIKAQLEIKKELAKAVEKDNSYQALRDTLKKEKELYQSLGQRILLENNADKLLKPYLELIHLNKHKFTVQEGALAFHPINSEAFNTLQQQFLELLKEREGALDRQLELEQAHLPTLDKEAKLKALKGEKSSLEKFRALFVQEMKKIAELSSRESQMEAKDERKN